jgi:DNA-binding NarL/FixJ family response regulator
MRVMPSEIKILIADDHPIFRAGLLQVIEKKSHHKVVGEAADGETALEQILELHPDVAILDLQMPKLGGFGVARALKNKDLEVKLIFLTMHQDEEMFNEAMDLGAQGYVLKESAVTDITNSIDMVSAGRNFISPQLSTYLLGRRQRSEELRKEKPALSRLTPTEIRILKLIADNKTSREIASDFYVSVRTIENHRANICAKLELHGAHALLSFALAHKSQLA